MQKNKQNKSKTKTTTKIKKTKNDKQTTTKPSKISPSRTHYRVQNIHHFKDTLTLSHSLTLSNRFIISQTHSPCPKNFTLSKTLILSHSLTLFQHIHQVKETLALSISLANPVQQIHHVKDTLIPPPPTPPLPISLSLTVDRLAGLVVRRQPRERKVPVSNPACAGIFSGSSHTSDFKIGTPVATLPGAWRSRVSAGTGRPGVSIL